MTLRIGLNWMPQWFVRYESLWSIARKLATGQMSSLRLMLQRALCPPEAPALTLFVGATTERSAWLSELLDMDACDLDGVWLDSTLPHRDDRSVCLGLRYCPTCMRGQFHSTLHQSYLLRACPMHGDRLTTCCPRCGAAKTAGSAPNVDSFSWCVKCHEPYFPEPGDWLDSYGAPRVGTSLADVFEKLRERSGAGHIESAAFNWAHEPGRVVPETQPAYALLGDALLGKATPIATETCELIAADEFVCPGWQQKHQMASVVQKSLSALAATVGLPPSLGLPLWGEHLDENRRAAALLTKWLGVYPDQSLAEAGRSLPPMTLSPVLLATRSRAVPAGAQIQGAAAELACVSSLVRGQFLDAIQSIREAAPATTWSHWPRLRDPARFPTVWTGVRTGDQAWQLSIFGPAVHQLAALKNPTATVGI